MRVPPVSRCRIPHCVPQTGYPTRRPVDVSQEVIVREVNCDTNKGTTVSDVIDERDKNGWSRWQTVSSGASRWVILSIPRPAPCWFRTIP